MSQFHPTNADLATDIALAELLPGGLFEGFTFATREDVMGLANSATPLRPFFGSYLADVFRMRDLIWLLGAFHSSSEGTSTAAIINEIAEPPSSFSRYYRGALLTGPISMNMPNRPGILFFDNDPIFQAPSNLGLMLYRDVVPEPSGGSLVIVATGFAVHLRLLGGRPKR